MTDEAPTAACLRLLRRFREATLAFGDRRAPARFVIDRNDGRVVMPVEPSAFKHPEFTLYLPSESDCDATILLVPRKIDRPEASEAVDRWSAYHGPIPDSIVWTTSAILGIKSTANPALAIMDESALTCPNALGTPEFRLIRQANADRELLTRTARAIAGIDLDDAQCIGIDPDGLDVRAPFGTVRLEFPRTAPDLPAAERMLTDLLSVGGAAR